MLEIRQLQVFLAVWKRRSFSKASQEVNLTQPTISGHIKSLEHTLGASLFDRSGREVIPTKAGEILFPYAKKIIQLQHQAEKDISLFQKGDKGTLELGSSNVPGQYILPQLISSFKQQHQNIKITLKVSDTPSITESVAAGYTELGIVDSRIHYSDISFEQCLSDEMVFACPANFMSSDAKEVTIRDIKKVPFLTREPGSGTRTILEKALKTTGTSLSSFNIIAEIGSNEAIKQAIKNGMGCSILSKCSIAEDIDLGRIHALKVSGANLLLNFYLIKHNHRTISPLGLSFRDFILSKSDCFRAVTP